MEVTSVREEIKRNVGLFVNNVSALTAPERKRGMYHVTLVRGEAAHSEKPYVRIHLSVPGSPELFHSFGLSLDTSEYRSPSALKRAAKSTLRDGYGPDGMRLRHEGPVRRLRRAVRDYFSEHSAPCID